MTFFFKLIFLNFYLPFFYFSLDGYLYFKPFLDFDFDYDLDFWGLDLVFLAGFLDFVSFFFDCLGLDLDLFDFGDFDFDLVLLTDEDFDDDC